MFNKKIEYGLEQLNRMVGGASLFLGCGAPYELSHTEMISRLSKSIEDIKETQSLILKRMGVEKTRAFFRVELTTIKKTK